MRLNFEGKTTHRPSAAEIARAIPRTLAPEEWTIELVGEDGVSIEADPAPEAGRFKVCYVEGRRLFDAANTLDADELERLLIAFLRQDGGWRRLVAWTVWTPPEPPTRRSPRLRPLLAALLAAVAITVIGWLWLLD